MTASQRDAVARPSLHILSGDIAGLARRFAYADAGGAHALVNGWALGWRLVAPAGMELVFRPEPRPVLGAIGRFSPPETVALDAMRRRIEKLETLRYVNYAQAEADCELLASRLADTYSREELSSFHFVAMPRGGMIVLGMLSYLLGLEPSQLEQQPPPTGTLVVVDDAALSGSAFHEFLSQSVATKVIFATLYCHPSLRAAIEAAEPRVTCVSANDLAGEDANAENDTDSKFVTSWRRRLTSNRYWIGDTEPICFAWSEPDWSYWNPIEGRVEDGWHVAPPSRCLRWRRENGGVPVPIQIQPEGTSPLKPGTRVLFGAIDGEVAIRHLETGAAFLLEGVAADMWNAIVERGDPVDAGRALAAIYDADPETIRADLDTFTRDLVAQDLMEWSDGAH